MASQQQQPHRITKPPSQYDEFFASSKSFATHFPQHAVQYVKSLFPIIGWLPRYNTTWLAGDLIAGLTVGLVVIPQALAYSNRLATLPPVFGLYASFFGVLIYALFATTKDVTIGPTAVLSLLVGQTLATYNTDDTSDAGKVKFAVALSFLTGLFQLFLGLFRIGLIVDFVPVSVIVGFTTGAGVQIIVGQLATLTGIKGVDTTQAPWQVLGAWIRRLNTISANKYDVAFGISTLVFILAIKFGTDYLAKKRPLWKYIGLLRNGLAVILFTAISYGVRKNVTIAIVGTVPRGLSGIPKPDLSINYLGFVLKAVPAALIVSVLEHIAVAKSYGRINGYRPNDNQELVAIGITNFFGAFLGAYPATGSFSRSAIKSQSGVRSPLAAFFTAIIILIALYTLTDAFYYIPNASLAAIISAAVTDLFVRPHTLQQLFKTNFIDFVSFWIACIVTFFSTIEIAIYSSVAFSLVVLLIRIARPKVRTLSRSETAGWIDAEGEGYSAGEASLTSSPDGIIVYRPYEALTYPNASYVTATLKSEILANFRYSGVHRKAGDRSWDDDTEERARKQEALVGTEKPLPELRAVVFDFSAVNGIDFTGLQALLDAREDLQRFTGRFVPFHFAHVRRDHLNVVWTIPVARAADRNAVAARGETELPRTSEADEDQAAGRYFHLSVDEAVQAAHAETANIVDRRDPSTEGGDKFVV
ncbi:sulfate transporter family-domain-containing protein [Zopfochytrium polystomum]|nr:sulfate transporter family-domain-containing protein [Zopfochytrium polystomum]